MAYTGTGINTSATIVEAASAAADYRGKCIKYVDGKAALAGAGELCMGVGLITNADQTAADADVDLQVKEIGLGLAGAAIVKGKELASDAEGKLVEAASGNFVIGVALEDAAAAGKFIRMQICKYYKA